MVELLTSAQKTTPRHPNMKTPIDLCRNATHDPCYGNPTLQQDFTRDASSVNLPRLFLQYFSIDSSGSCRCVRFVFPPLLSIFSRFRRRRV